ncbi:MAG: alpha/beta fold hydrolase [Actinomycetota bacterium]|nr:alpha/beta fold hydrolase [Actinomycetota bacterium]
MTSVQVVHGAGLDGELAVRMRRSLAGTALGQRRATVVLDAGESGVWTVELAGGRGRARRGSAPRSDLVVRCTASVLSQIVTGEVSGVHAFLDGRVGVRGDLALALQLDGLFDGGDRPDEHPRWREVEAMGVRTAYLEAGPPDAPPVVVLHGLGATNASMLPVLADLARDHRVLSPDTPGFGASEAPPSPYTSSWFAAWLEAFQGVTGSRGAVLVGNSLGGRIALEAGLQHARSVRALVLLAPSPAFRRIRHFVPLVRLLPAQLAGLPMLPPARGLFVEAVRAMMSVPDRLPEAWIDAAADEAVRVLRSPAHRVAFLSAARQIYLEEAYGRHGFWARLPGLMPPALFVWGDRDRLVPASFARHVADCLPEAGSVVLEDCGHVPQFEHPEETMALVRGFLASL